MWYLYATRTTYTPNISTGGSETDEEQNLVATFSSKILAEEFVADCRLSTPIRHNWGNDEPFKRSSLLRGYGFVEITDEVPEIPQVPYDPTSTGRKV